MKSLIEREIQKRFSFEYGRQGTGYQKHTFLEKYLPKWTGFIGADCHLLYFPDGSFIPKHVDTVKEGKHFRLNIVLKNADEGGQFITNGGYRLFNRIFFFRSDINEHEVTRCTGTRYVLSIGVVKI